jgi:hypothetical protein
MKYTERKEWLYDPALFLRSDTQTALGMHSEFIRATSPRPPPKFFEVDHATAKYDDLWHFPLDSHNQFARTLDIPTIVKQEKANWRLTKAGLVPQQKIQLWLGNLILKELDYIPVRGDLVFFQGYRYVIVNAVPNPEAYWQQTNVWLGMVADAIIPAEGDARPLLNPSEAAAGEIRQTRPVAEA